MLLRPRITGGLEKWPLQGVCSGTSRRRRGASFGQAVLGATHEKRCAPSAIRRSGSFCVSGAGWFRVCAAGWTFASGTGGTTSWPEPDRAKFECIVGPPAFHRHGRHPTFEFICCNALCGIRESRARGDVGFAKCECESGGTRWYAHPPGVAQRYFDSQRSARRSRLF
jgi:hypothetical protein